MIDLSNKDDLEVLKKEEFSVLMIWADGCGVCAHAKPLYEAIEPKFPAFNFYKMQMADENYGFYKKYEEEKEIEVPAVDEDGDAIIDARGNQMKRKIKTIINEVPKYYVFHGSEATEEDEYGLLGKVDGHNLEQLEAILEQIKAMSDEEQEVQNGQA